MAANSEYKFHPDDQPCLEEPDYISPVAQANQVVTKYLKQRSQAEGLNGRKYAYILARFQSESVVEKHLIKCLRAWKKCRKEVLDELNLHHPHAYKGLTQAGPRDVEEIISDLDLINKEIGLLEIFLNSPAAAEAIDN